VRAVAEGATSGVLAAAEPELLRFRDREARGRELRALVRAVAEGLALGATAGAPPVVARGELHRVRAALRAEWSARASPPLESVGILEVGEAREAAEERELDAADGAVPLLADDDLGPALRLFLVRKVHLVAVDEKDHVGVLLDRARLAQVRHHGAPVVTLLDRARELRERDHRHLELLGERRERARYLRALGRAVLALRARRHELQIVDDHQAELRVLALEPPRARAHFERIQCRRVIYVDLSLM